MCVFITAINYYCSTLLLLFITAVPNTKLCAWGEEDSGGHIIKLFARGGGCVCLLLQYLLQSCSRGGGGTMEDMCYRRDYEPRPVWTLVCPSRTSERGGEGYCVKEEGGEEGERERERARKVRLYYSLGYSG